MNSRLDAITQKILPQWIYSRLIGNWNKEGFAKYFNQTGWLLIAKTLAFAISFFMVAIVARYLGPENLGKIGYAQSFIAIFSLFASLGVAQIVMRDLVAHPEKENQILGTVFFIKLVCGILTMIAVGIVAHFTSTDPILTWLILIISLTFIIQPFGVSSDIFTARVKGKYTAYSQIILTVVIQVVKLLIIFFGKGIIYFALVLVLEAFLSAALALIFYIRVFRHTPFKWHWNTDYAKVLIVSSIPLLIAGVSSYIFGQIDKVMLQPLMGSAAVGIYGSAVTVTQLLAGFVPGILIGALIPALINAHKTDQETYRHRLRALNIFAGGVALFIASIVFIFAPFIISIIYGVEFVSAVPVLRIFVWSSVLGIFMVIANQHLIITNRTTPLLIISLLAAGLNVLLNYILIPLLGMNGAAIATIISFLIYLCLVYFSLRIKRI